MIFLSLINPKFIYNTVSITKNLNYKKKINYKIIYIRKTYKTTKGKRKIKYTTISIIGKNNFIFGLGIGKNNSITTSINLSQISARNNFFSLSKLLLILSYKKNIKYKNKNCSILIRKTTKEYFSGNLLFKNIFSCANINTNICIKVYSKNVFIIINTFLKLLFLIND